MNKWTLYIYYNMQSIILGSIAIFNTASFTDMTIYLYVYLFMFVNLGLSSLINYQHSVSTMNTKYACI